MEKEKHPSHGGGLPPPPSGRFPGGKATTFDAKIESPPSSVDYPFESSSDSSCFSHDVSQMPDNPPKKLGHRRAQSHSDILTLPDDICFDSDLGSVGAAEGPSLTDETYEDMLSMYLDADRFNPSSAMSGSEVSDPSAMELGGGDGSREVNVGVGSGGKPRVRHQHSQSMDGSMNINAEMLMAGSADAVPGDPKKAMSDAKLAELALVDPKRAKKIWANRQSAARSKERKIRYIAELERKLQMLQNEAASRSAQLALMQRDANDLAVENGELKLRVQATEQQVHLQDALNDTLKDEIQHLKRLTGQPSSCAQMTNLTSSCSSHPFFPNNRSSSSSSRNAILNAQQFQQLQIHSRTHHHHHHHQ